MTPQELSLAKHHADLSAINQGYPLPDGFTITYNEDTKLIKFFLDDESYGSLAEPQDVIVSRWNGKEWEDK